VCLPTKRGDGTCRHCGKSLPDATQRREFCDADCRRAAHRKKMKAARRLRRVRYYARKFRDISMSFDGRTSGSVTAGVPTRLSTCSLREAVLCG
jgi:hypothetical protein